MEIMTTHTVWAIFYWDTLYITSTIVSVMQNHSWGNSNCSCLYDDLQNGTYHYLHASKPAVHYTLSATIKRPPATYQAFAVGA